MKNFAFVVLALACIALLSQPVQSQEVVFIVPDDAPTIQDAVNQANPGATIIIRTGRYREAIVIQKDRIRLVAAEEPGTVVIEGKELGAVTGIHLKNASGVELRGLTVQNFDGFIGPGPLDYHAGILVEGGRANVIHHNRLHLNGTNLLLIGSDRNHIVGNEVVAAKHTGILLIEGSDSNTIKGNFGYDNDARPVALDPLLLPGCGIEIHNSNDNVVKDNELFRNGRGIMLATNASGNQVIGNMAHDNVRFGIAAFAGTAPTQNNLFQNNVAINNAFRLVKNADGDVIGDGGVEEGADLFDELGGENTLNTWEDNVSEANNVGGAVIQCAVKQLCHNSDRQPRR